MNLSGEGTLLIIAAVLLAGCAGRLPIPDEKAQSQIQAKCAPVISWLGAEKEKFGRYPQMLPGELDATLKRLNPHSKYAPSLDGNRFSIHIGDYAQDEWLYFYDSETHSWGLDT